MNKDYRLPTKYIQNIARKGKRLSSELIDIRVWWDNSVENPKFAFAVGLKVSKSAVVRNTVKRKLRAAISSVVKEVNLKKGSYLIVAKSSKLDQYKSQEIKDILMSLLQV